MTHVNATEFRKHLFEYLDRVESGETIAIQRKNKEIGRIVPSESPKSRDWQDRMTCKLEILVDPDELIKPIEGVWEDYI